MSTPAESLRTATDAELASRVLAAQPGLARAEEDELCRRFAPRIRRYGLRHLADPHAADDLVQRALATAVDGLRARKLREPDAIAGYVLGICRSLALGDARGERRRADLLGRYGEGLHAVQEPAAESDLDRLRDCMKRLAERSRTLLVMTFFAQLDSARIAGELGLSQANVRVVRHRALRQLADCVKGGQP